MTTVLQHDWATIIYTLRIRKCDSFDQILSRVCIHEGGWARNYPLYGYVFTRILFCKHVIKTDPPLTDSSRLTSRFRFLLPCGELSLELGVAVFCVTTFSSNTDNFCSKVVCFASRASCLVMIVRSNICCSCKRVRKSGLFYPVSVP